MRLPHMTIQLWMITTAFVAALCWAITTEAGFVTVSATIGGLFALGAMHHPWVLLAIAVSVWVVFPRDYHSYDQTFFAGCYQLGWLWGAIAGIIIRYGRPGDKGSPGKKRATGKKRGTLRQEARKRRIANHVKPFTGTLRVTNPVR
jgi:hypothetical protein